MYQIGKRIFILPQRIAKHNKFFNKTTIMVASDHIISNKTVADDCTSKDLSTIKKSWKSQSLNLENLNDMNQIPVTGTVESAAGFIKSEIAQFSDDSKEPSQQSGENEPKKKKKQPAEVLPVDFGRLDFRVGKIIEVRKHPDADSLYLLKIDCGEPQSRHVVAGLVNFVPIEDMKDRMVVIMCNLKPVKMRGATSEAMLLCASTSEKVEILLPPTAAVPGDLVHCEGFTRNPDAQLNPKKKIFETCAPDLTTNDFLQACYKGSPWNIPGKGFIVSQTLKNVNVR